VYEREGAVGKVVELPAITDQDKFNDFGKAFAAIGSPSDGYYFLILETPDLFRFYQVMFRYQGQVNPRLEERYRYIGEVQDDPQIFTVNRRSVTGLTVKLIGVLAGEDELFVDLRREPPGFAGEDVLASVGAIQHDDNSPASVIAAMIQAIKLGDQVTWRSLFADWQVVTGESGRPVIDRSYGDAGEYHSEWEYSRRLITGDVYDARVEQVERIERVLAGDPATNLPSVDEVTVWVDHYGLFDGEYRAFQSINVNRRWTLQRLDGGPWKITSVQSL
jgi:hypothetical protein